MRRRDRVRAGTRDVRAPRQTGAEERAWTAFGPRAAPVVPAGPAAVDDAPDLLAAVSDALIQAHRAAKEEGDPQTLALIERALFRVGRRLAYRLSPAAAGLFHH